MYLARYTNPRLTGVVIKETVRCGKKDCHCVHGEGLHRWYYYLYYRSFDNGTWKLKKEYVKKSKVKYLRAKIKETKNKEIATKVRMSDNLSFLKDTSQYTRGNISVEELLKTIYEIT